MKTIGMFLFALLVGGLTTLTVSACGDNVVAAVPEACVPSDGEPSLFCNETSCSEDPAANQLCSDTFTACAMSADATLEGCVAAALDVCPEPAEPDPTLFCNETYCSADEVKNQDCRQFFTACLIENPTLNTGECVAGALAVCRDGPSLFCDADTCSVNPVKQQQCTVNFAACLAAAGQADYDECVAAQFVFCRAP